MSVSEPFQGTGRVIGQKAAPPYFVFEILNMVAMRISIMQPYFFPYIGYFQLINASDIFVCFDDVNFIKKGWIHRNRLYFNGDIRYFTVPIDNASQFKKINETEVSGHEFKKWKYKFISSIESFYKKQPYFLEGMNIVEMVLFSNFSKISEIAANSLIACCNILNIKTPFKYSSQIKNDGNLKKELRLVDICKQNKCNSYLNASGGKHIYTSDMFSRHGIKLEFINPNISTYPVHGRTFIPYLSILDPIMCCGSDYVRENLISDYTVEAA